MTTSSPTVVSELNLDVPLTPPIGPELPSIRSDSLDLSELGQVDSPILRLKKQMMEALMSPDSESSSFHVTSSASSSDNKDMDVHSTETSEEATDLTDKPVLKHQPKSQSETEDITESRDISTSPRLLNSSRVLQRKSDPTIDEKNLLHSEESVSRLLISRVRQ